MLYSRLPTLLTLQADARRAISIITVIPYAAPTNAQCLYSIPALSRFGTLPTAARAAWTHVAFRVTSTLAITMGGAFTNSHHFGLLLLCGGKPPQ